MYQENYKVNVYTIVSKVAYLIGVEERLFQRRGQSPL